MADRVGHLAYKLVLGALRTVVVWLHPTEDGVELALSFELPTVTLCLDNLKELMLVCFHRLPCLRGGWPHTRFGFTDLLKGLLTIAKRGQRCWGFAARLGPHKRLDLLMDGVAFGCALKALFEKLLVIEAS